MLRASVIVAFYNRIDYLRLVLAGLERQTTLDFEVIIADDGSSNNVVAELQYLVKSMPFPVHHIWHPDKGFRKNRVLNRAIVSSNSNYLIFIDGDCIPHERFVQEHIENQSKGSCLTGRRVNLSEKVSKLLTYEKVKQGFLEKNLLLLVLDGLFGKSNHVEKGIYIRQKGLRSWINRKTKGLLGCNFSLYKEDILSINGFDERYELPSIGEDTDIQFRLELCNMQIKPLNQIAVQYHLYHKQQERPEENRKLFQQIVEQKIAFSPYGIEQKAVNHP